MRGRAAILGLSGLALAATVCAAAMVERADRDAPIQITSERMSGDLAKGLTVFEGSVVIVQGAATVRADRVEVYSAPEGRTGSTEGDSPEKVVAIGNVSFHQAPEANRREINATGERGVFDQRADTVTMTGNPRLWQGKNVVTGEEMVFRVGTDQYEVKGQPDKRIRAVFYPEQKTTPTPAPNP